MLMHALEVLCNEPWCCILCWQFDMQFSYATHLAHPVLCRPTHFNISGYASGLKSFYLSNKCILIQQFLDILENKTKILRCIFLKF